MAEQFITPEQGRSHSHHLHGLIPTGSGGDSPAVCAEADGVACRPKLPSAQVSDVEFATFGHVRRRGIAHVGVVRPHDPLALRAVKPEKVSQSFEHVAVAQIPGFP